MTGLAARVPDRETRAGRNCPLSYRYSPRVFDRAPQLVADTIFVVGGLYGNCEALDAIVAMAEAEPGPATLVFNGDFHWFDVDPLDFGRVDREVARHVAIRGNVETEIAQDESDAGCGCAYPADVSDADVSRSNAILERLRKTACAVTGARERLAGLPMHLTARVGDARVGIVHGDAASLAGWGFAHDRLDAPGHSRWVEGAFRDACVDVFASTHTCLPALRAFDGGVVANNGAAGMPNFTGTHFGLVTRISLSPSADSRCVFARRHAGAWIEGVRVDYDHPRWLRRFERDWPAGSPAHRSYFRRIVEGPRFALAAEHGAA
ncbi:MAG: hypothetical protein ABIR98_03170 [Usitatibacter sp.]